MDYDSIMRKYIQNRNGDRRLAKRIIYQFLGFLKINHLDLSDLNPMHYRDFLFDFIGIKSPLRLKIYLEDLGELMDWFDSENINGTAKQKFILGLEELSFEYLQQFIVPGGQYISKESFDDILEAVDNGHSGLTSLMIALAFSGFQGFSEIAKIRVEDINFPRIGSENKPFTIKTNGNDMDIDGSVTKYLDFVLCGTKNEIEDSMSEPVKLLRLYRRSSHIFPSPGQGDDETISRFLGKVYKNEMVKCGYGDYKISSFYFSGVLYRISRKFDLEIFLRQVFYDAKGKANILRYDKINKMFEDKGVKVHHATLLKFIRNNM